ncbi:hypothetical protein Dimus_011216 [Dionaea muscipula]
MFSLRLLRPNASPLILHRCLTSLTLKQILLLPRNHHCIAYRNGIWLLRDSRSFSCRAILGVVPASASASASSLLGIPSLGFALCFLLGFAFSSLFYIDGCCERISM